MSARNLLSLLSENEAIAQMVLVHLKPDTDCEYADEWPPCYKPWLYLALQVSKGLTEVFDKTHCWEAYFDVKCEHLRSPYARFAVQTFVRCKHKHAPPPPGVLKPGDITINLSVQPSKSFARQAIPQFISARDMLYAYIPPFEMPCSEFLWSEKAPIGIITSSSDTQGCGQRYHVGDIPVVVSFLSSSNENDDVKRQKKVLDGDIHALCESLSNCDVTPDRSYECSECGEEQHLLHHDFSSWADDDEVVGDE